jgi:hypothetical protein
MGGGNNQNNANSTTPGMDVLLITTAYTVLCIIIGFLFKCRKRKWRNKKENAAAKPGNEEKDDQNTPEAWMDTNPYMCAVDEVIENSLFDHDVEKSLDTKTVESDDSSKAYEYWENMIGPEAETSYELYEEDTGNDDKNLQVRPSKEMIEIASEPNIASITTDSSYELYKDDTGTTDKNLQVRPSKEMIEIASEPNIVSITTDPSCELYKDDTGNADKNLEVRPSREMMEIPPEPTIASITTDSAITKSQQRGNMQASSENFTDHPPIKSDKPVAKGNEKKVSERRFPFGRKKRTFSVVKIEMKSNGLSLRKKRRFSIKNMETISNDTINLDEAVDEKKTRSRRFNRLFHKPNSLEIELKAERWGSPKDVDESYEYFDDYEDPIEVEKQFDPDLNHSRHTSCSKDASKSEEIVDRSGEGDDTYEKEMKEIYKLAVP